MSSYQPAMPTDPRPRPSVVTAAGYLLYAVAGLFALNAIISLSTIGKVTDVAETESGAADVQGLKSVVEFAAVAGVVFDLVIVALFVVLGVFVLRGRNGMRIATFVIAGIGALCTLCGTVSGSLTTRFSTQDDSLTSTQSDALRNAIPGWARTTTILVEVIILIALCLVIIFLALRSSNEYFRKPQPVMVVGYPAYPAFPGYSVPQQGQPGQAGYPQPGQPGYPQPGPPVYPQASAVPPAAPSPWAVPGSTPPYPGDATTAADPTRQDPDQS